MGGYEDQMRGKPLLATPVVIEVMGELLTVYRLEVAPDGPDESSPQPTGLDDGEASREDWARRRVAAEGKDWTTHMAKFSGTVVQREQPDGPDEGSPRDA